MSRCSHRLPLVIHNVKMVNEGQIVEGELLVDVGGYIAEVTTGSLSLNPNRRYEILDGKGQYLFPGVIDTHVHFRDPGFTHKGDIQTESCAAVAGGVTSFCDMPNTKPQTTTNEALRAKKASAAGRSHANYAFYLGATVDNLDEIRTCDPHEVPAIKLFMGSSTGGMQLTAEEQLAAVFRDAPILIATHCETDAIISQNLARAKAAYPNGIPFTEHARIRSTESCVESVKLAQHLAREYDARLHVLHLSAAEELSLFADPALRLAGRITCETCPHYLYFTDEDYRVYQWQIKCNPAIKGREDRAALIAALKSGIIHTIGTDHAPHLTTEKLKDYEHSPSGIPSIQYSLLLMLRLAEAEGIPFPRIAELMSHTPARLFGVEKRGYIREGYWADLVFVAPCLGGKRFMNSYGTESRCEWSPYEGLDSRYYIRRTLVNGQVAYCYTHGVQEAGGVPLTFNGNERNGRLL